MKKAIGYIRVSTKDQVENGFSLDNQISRIQAYANYHGYELLDIYSDKGISGYKKVKRPGYDQLMEAVRNQEANHVIVYSISRFARNTITTLQAVEAMKQSSMHFHSVCENIDTSSAAGELFLSLLAALAQMESRQISERVRDIKKSCKRDLKRYSAPIFGFKNNKDLEIEENEMQVVRQVHSLKSQNLSPRKIATHLNEIGVKAKSGGQFYHSHVTNMLKNPIYKNFIS